MELTSSHLNCGQFCLAWKSVGSKRKKEMARFGFQFCKDFEGWGVLGACTSAVFRMPDSVLWVPSERWGGSAAWRDWPMLFTQQSTTPWVLFLSLAQANIAGNWEFKYMKIVKLLSSAEQIEVSVLFSLQSMKMVVLNYVDSSLNRWQNSWPVCVIAQYPKLPALNLHSYRQATHVPHGSSLVQVTCKTLSKQLQTFLAQHGYCWALCIQLKHDEHMVELQSVLKFMTSQIPCAGKS